MTYLFYNRKSRCSVQFKSRNDTIKKRKVKKLPLIKEIKTSSDKKNSPEIVQDQSRNSVCDEMPAEVWAWSWNSHGEVTV